MLKTGTVPVADEIHKLPAAVNGESKSPVRRILPEELLTHLPVKGKAPMAAEDEEEEELRKLQAEMAM